jgi:spermidine synthase
MRIIRFIILLLFFLSGFCSLLYEVVWTRIFGLIFGNTTLAISTVLSAFMLGLGLGGLLFGKLSKRYENHLKLYGLLEIGIALTALLIPLLQPLIENLFSLIYHNLYQFSFIYHMLQFLIVFLVMAPATFLMGGTLPVLSHVMVKEKDKIGYDIGKLYSINTFGAVCGVMLTGFALIRILGVFQSIYLAVFLNIIIGVTAYLMSGFSSQHIPAEVEVNLHENKILNQKGEIALWVMAISGFVALAYEVLWTRILVFIMTNSVYAFAIMLATFLFGIAFGAYIGGILAQRHQRTMALLGIVQIALAISAFITSVVLINLASIHHMIFTAQPTTSWWQWNTVRFFESFIIMVLPTILMGASFPIASKIVVQDLPNIGKGVGKLYFFNTIGGMLGSFVTGFVLISLMGTPATMGSMIMVSLLLGILLIIYQMREKSYKFILSYSIVSLCIIVFFIQLPSKELFTAAYNVTEQEYPLIDYREGIEGTITVHRAQHTMQQNKRIDVDGLNVAGTSFMLRTLQTLQGHLPPIVHANSKQILQIGFGTGQTSYSALLHPVERFLLVEISRDIIDFAQLYFSELNKDVLNHENFDYVILDGKNFVKYTSNKYDIIMNDANYAVATSSASLFTKDHFENCKGKLQGGGILSTWMTTDLDPQDFRIVLKTFQSVFPHCLLWMAPNCINKQVVLMGSLKEIEIDFEKIQRIFSKQAILEDLSNINITSVYDLINCIVLDNDGIRGISEEAAINSDNHPILEFSTHSIRARDFCAFQNLAQIILRRPNLRKIIKFPTDPEDQKKIISNLNRNERAAKELLQGMMQFYQGKTNLALETVLNASRKIPESKLAAQIFEQMDLITAQLNRELMQNPYDLNANLTLSRHLIGLSQYSTALKQLQRIALRDSSNPLIYYEMARCYLGLNQSDSAKFYITKSLNLDDKQPGIFYFLGVVLSKENNSEEALEAYQQAITLDPRMYEAYNAMGRIYKSQEKYEKAIMAFKKSLDIFELQPQVIEHIADCLLHSNNSVAAIAQYKRALSMDYQSSDLLFNLGNTYFLNDEIANAERSYKLALEIDSTNAEIYYNLGNCYVKQGNFDVAIKAYKNAITLNKAQPDYFNNLAMSYRYSNRIKQALQVFDQGLRLHKDSPLLKQNEAETRKLYKERVE